MAKNTSGVKKPSMAKEILKGIRKGARSTISGKTNSAGTYSQLIQDKKK